MAIKDVTSFGGDVQKMHEGQLLLENSGFTPDQIALCNKRYEESPFPNYADWCRAYIALNSIKPADDAGLVLDGNLIIKALQSNKKIKSPFKVSKNKSRA